MVGGREDGEVGEEGETYRRQSPRSCESKEASEDSTEVHFALRISVSKISTSRAVLCCVVLCCARYIPTSQHADTPSSSSLLFVNPSTLPPRTTGAAIPGCRVCGSRGRSEGACVGAPSACALVWIHCLSPRPCADPVCVSLQPITLRACVSRYEGVEQGGEWMIFFHSIIYS